MPTCIRRSISFKRGLSVPISSTLGGESEKLQGSRRRRGPTQLGQRARGVVSLHLRTLAREGRMTVTIGRRELLAALGGVAAWPLAAHAPIDLTQMPQHGHPGTFDCRLDGGVRPR